MLTKRELNKKYFLNSSWMQFIICGHVEYNKILCDLKRILEIMRQNKKIKTWFFLNKKQKILVKIEFIEKYKYELLDINTMLMRKYKRITVKIDTFEPEMYQFGGNKGWEVAKKYFNNVSLLIGENKKSEQEKNKFAIITIFDLLLRVTGDSFEAWDVLQKLMTIRGVNQNFNFKNIKKNKLFRNINLLFDSPQKFYFQRLQDKEMIKRIITTNIFLVHQIEKKKFSLMFSIRKILPYYIIFIFNMFLVSGTEQKAIIKCLSLFLNPEKYK